MKKHLYSTIPVALVALLGLFVVSSLGLQTGKVVERIEINPYAPVSSMVCPDPNYPVPVYQDRTTTGTGKMVLVDCVKEGTVIKQTRERFRPTSYRDRYPSPYQFSYEKLT